MKKAILLEVIIYLLFLLFMYTGFSKLLMYDVYIEDLGRQDILAPFAGILVWAIPLVEIVIAVALIVGKTRKIGLYGSLGLMTLFTVYVIYVMSFQSKWPCSCGGMIRDLTWPQHLVFNLFFVAISVVGLWIMKRPKDAVARIDSRLAGI